MSYSRIILLIILLLIGLPLGAETVYVTDELRLGVHLTRDTSGRPFAFLKSGDRAELLERDGALTLVQLEDQRSGWVRGSFLQTEEPALRRIAGVEAERDRLAAEVEKLQARSGAQERQRLEDAAREAAEQAQAAKDEVARLNAENLGLRDDLAALRSGVPRSWLWTGVTGALLFGVFLAWRWFDYRSRRRHGGFRIY